jgi:hypothetical protein
LDGQSRGELPDLSGCRTDGPGQHPEALVEQVSHHPDEQDGEDADRDVEEDPEHG